MLLQAGCLGVLGSTLLLCRPRLSRLSLACLQLLCDPHRLRDENEDSARSVPALLLPRQGFLSRVCVDRLGVTVPCRDAAMALLRR